MTAVLSLLGAAIFLTAAASLYVKKATEYLAASESPWDRLFVNAKRAIADPTMPNHVVGFAAAAVMCAGCGCLTRRILLDWLIGRERRLERGKRDAFWNAMTKDQREIFTKVVVNAIFYDSLRAPISGFIVRRFVFPWLRAAAEEEAPPVKRTVAAMAVSSREAIASRSEGKRLLALQH